MPALKRLREGTKLLLKGKESIPRKARAARALQADALKNLSKGNRRSIQVSRGIGRVERAFKKKKI